VSRRACCGYCFAFPGRALCFEVCAQVVSSGGAQVGPEGVQRSVANFAAEGVWLSAGPATDVLTAKPREAASRQAVGSHLSTRERAFWRRMAPDHRLSAASTKRSMTSFRQGWVSKRTHRPCIDARTGVVDHPLQRCSADLDRTDGPETSARRRFVCGYHGNSVVKKTAPVRSFPARQSRGGLATRGGDLPASLITWATEPSWCANANDLRAV